MNFFFYHRASKSNQNMLSVSLGTVPVVKPVSGYLGTV